MASQQDISIAKDFEKILFTEFNSIKGWDPKNLNINYVKGAKKTLADNKARSNAFKSTDKQLEQEVITIGNASDVIVTFLTNVESSINSNDPVSAEKYYNDILINAQASPLPTITVAAPVTAPPPVTVPSGTKTGPSGPAPGPALFKRAVYAVGPVVSRPVTVPFVPFVSAFGGKFEIPGPEKARTTLAGPEFTSLRPKKPKSSIISSRWDSLNYTWDPAEDNYEYVDVDHYSQSIISKMDLIHLLDKGIVEKLDGFKKLRAKIAGADPSHYGYLVNRENSILFGYTVALEKEFQSLFDMIFEMCKNLFISISQNHYYWPRQKVVSELVKNLQKPYDEGKKEIYEKLGHNEKEFIKKHTYKK